MSDPKDRPEKQESLPFPPTPSGSIAGRTMQESVYKPQPKPRRLPVELAEHSDRADRRCRPCPSGDVWRRSANAIHGPHRQGGDRV